MDTSADINFIQSRCEKDTVSVVIDGNLRDPRAYPDPASFAVNLLEPIKLVFGYDILDATIPSSMYNVSSKTSTFAYFTFDADLSDPLKHALNRELFSTSSLLYQVFAKATDNVKYTLIVSDLPFAISPSGTFVVFDTNMNYVGSTLSPPAAGSEMTFHVFDLPVGFYASNNLVTEFEKMSSPFTIRIDALSFRLTLDCPDKPFAVYVPRTTVKKHMGFTTSSPFLYLSPSLLLGWSLTSPGIANFKTISYIILRCREIEEHVFREDVQGASGIGIFKVVDVNDVSHLRFDFVNFVRRPFHPISNLSKLTLSFENTDGTPCDFNGVSPMLVLGVKRYMPIKPVDFGSVYSLNPNYDPDYMKYHLKTMEISQLYDKQITERHGVLPSVARFAEEHNRHAIDPQMRMPLREDFEDHESDDTIDSSSMDSDSEDDVGPSAFRSSIYKAHVDFF